MLINIFKAGRGDSFLLSWDDKKMLIDSGIPATCRQSINKNFPSLKDINYFVLTHIDYDHIGGIIKLLRQAKKEDIDECTIFYANTIELIKYKNDDKVGFHHGEEFSELLFNLGISNDSLISGEVLELHGLNITILSPTPVILENLKANWIKAMEESLILPENEGYVSVKNKDFSIDLDTEVTESEKSVENDLLNAASVAMLIEHKGRSSLMLGDAHSSVVSEGIRSILSQSGKNKLEVDVIKISHHGSKHNTTYDFLSLVSCNRFIISTNGAGPYYHPDYETLSKLVQHVKKNGFQQIVFYFNYNIPSEFNIVNEHDLGIEIIKVITSEVIV